MFMYVLFKDTSDIFRCNSFNYGTISIIFGSNITQRFAFFIVVQHFNFRTAHIFVRDCTEFFLEPNLLRGTALSMAWWHDRAFS